jgi:hypothetical protein
MRLRVNSAAPRIHIPLQRLALCLDCDVCFELGQTECPACGSQTWSPLARFIGEVSEKEVVRAVHALVDETKGSARPTADSPRHLLIVSRDQPKLYKALLTELKGNPTVTVTQDRRTKAQSANGRGNLRWRNVDQQIRALGWAIVRAESPAPRGR